MNSKDLSHSLKSSASGFHSSELPVDNRIRAHADKSSQFPFPRPVPVAGRGGPIPEFGQTPVDLTGGFAVETYEAEVSACSTASARWRMEESGFSKWANAPRASTRSLVLPSSLYAVITMT